MNVSAGTRAKRAVGLSVYGVSLLCHVFYLLLLWLRADSEGVPPFHVTTLRLLLLSSLAISSVLCLLGMWTSMPFVTNVLMAARLVLFARIVYPLANYALPLRILSLPLVIEGAFYLSLHASLVFVTCVLAVPISLQLETPLQHLGPSSPSVPPEQTLWACLLLVVIFALSLTTKGLLKALLNSKNDQEKSQAAIGRILRGYVDLQEGTRRAVNEATELERKRVVSELHDSIGYAFVTTIIMIEAALDLVDTAQKRLRAHLRKALSQAKQALNDVRATLRQSLPRSKDKDSGIKNLKKLARAFQQTTGMRIDLSLVVVPPHLSNGNDVCLYELVREGLINSYKHGRAAAVTIRLWIDDASLLIRLQDDGRGCHQVVDGIGLAGLRMRIAGLGGRFSAYGTENGFVIEAALPLGGVSQT